MSWAEAKQTQKLLAVDALGIKYFQTLGPLPTLGCPRVVGSPWESRSASILSVILGFMKVSMLTFKIVYFMGSIIEMFIFTPLPFLASQFLVKFHFFVMT